MRKGLCEINVSDWRIRVQGPTGVSLHATHAGLSDEKVKDEIGRSVQDICSAVKGGVLLFLPSYSAMAGLRQRWDSTGMLRRLEKSKVRL